MSADISNLIDLTGSECLNEEQAHPFRPIFADGSEKAFLQSDTDQQLLLTLAFKEKVKINAIKFTAPTDGTGPRKVKLFSNRLHMGFDQAEDDPASQDIELKEADLADGATPTVLKLVKFQNLDSLTIFVQENQGDEEKTTINKIQLIGSSQNPSDGSGASAQNEVHHVKNEQEYQALKATKDKLVVVDFSAEWCAPCKGIAPHFAAFSNRYKDSAVFIHVDVDKTKIENAADVKALPTFKFFKNGNLLGKFEGADIAKLESMIKGLK